MLSFAYTLFEYGVNSLSHTNFLVLQPCSTSPSSPRALPTAHSPATEFTSKTARSLEFRLGQLRDVTLTRLRTEVSKSVERRLKHIKDVIPSTVDMKLQVSVCQRSCTFRAFDGRPTPPPWEKRGDADD